MMNFQIYVVIVVLWALFSSGTNQSKYLDPTGTYQLQSKTYKQDGETYGATGKIQIKKLNSNKIIMTFIVNKGAPSYNSGSFVDTLEYKINKIIYTCPEYDTTCKITFDFSKKGLVVKEKTADYNFGCGFGHAVVADGFYKRISSKTPVLIEPLTGEKL